MQVVWMNEAKGLLKAAVAYGLNTFGSTVTSRFITEIRNNNIRLAHFPRIGKIESLLAGRNREYRSLLVHKHYKVIYYIENETIFIVALWDTRSNPKTLKEKVK